MDNNASPLQPASNNAIPIKIKAMFVQLQVKLSLVKVLANNFLRNKLEKLEKIPAFLKCIEFARRLKRPFLRLIKIVLISYFVISLILISISLLIDPNTYKSRIETLFFEKTGQTLILQGELEWRYFPFSLQAEEVTLKFKQKSKTETLMLQKVKLTPSILASLIGRITVRVSLSNVQFRTYNIPKLRTKVKFNAGILQLLNNKIDLVKGKNKGTLVINKIIIDTNGDIPKFQVKHQESQFQLPLLLSVLETKARITGDTDINLDLTAEGTDIKAIKKSVNGTCDLEISRGHVHGVDLLGSLKEAKSLIGSIAAKISGTFSDAFEKLLHRKHNEFSGMTPFNKVKINLTVQNGVLNLHHLAIHHPHFRVQGKGGMNLFNSALDYRLEAVYKEQSPIKHSDLQPGGLAPLIVNISGTVENPKIKPDMDSYMQYIRGSSMNNAAKSIKKKENSKNHHSNQSKQSNQSKKHKDIVNPFKKIFGG